MKKILLYICTSLLLLCAHSNLQAQVLEVCAGDGTDSVTLSVSNYQYGLIQWQVSADGVLWQDIVDANDTILSFLPKGNGYYRAMISYNNCPYDSSQVSHIMLLPEAYAGPDRMVNAGCMTQLMGNELDGVRAMWEVLEGDDAVIDDVEDPYTLFSGTDSLYKLQWTLANECGVSHDTIEIRYVEPIFYDAIVVVDTTDQIFGDSLERYLGLYRIKFNDPVPVVTDSTILVGIPYGGFLRKVLYVEHRGDTVLMYTKQATLDDVIERGAISFDALAADQGTRNRGLYVRMNHLPTRGELLQNPQYRDGRIRYYDFPMGSAASDNISSPQSRGWNLGLPLFTSDHFNVNANIKISNINFGSADPYFDFSFQKDESGITGFWKVGMERNVSFKLKLEGGFSGTALKVPILPPFETRQLIMVGYIPVEVCLSYKFNAVVKGSASVTSKTFTVSGPYKVGLTLDINENEAKLHPTPPTESITVVPDANSAGYANVDLSLSLDHEVNLKLYEVLGPYFSISTPKVSIGMCHTINNDDFIHNYHLKVEIPWKIGLKGEIFKRKMFDINYGDSWKVFNWSRPGKVQRYVDNSSDYHNFQVNDIVPVKVQVFGHAGTNLEDAPIAFMPLAEIGGDILNTESDISQIMSPVPNAKVTFSTTNGTLGHRVDVIDPNYGYSGLDFTSEPVEVYANQNGIATAYWKPNNPNFNFIEARVTDCSGKDVEGSPVVIAVDNCGNSDLSLDIVNGELRPSGGSCNNCYEYSSSLSGVPSFAWSPVKPFPLTPGSTYFVRAGTCVASTVCRLADCELDLTHSIQGDHLIATVKNGKKPFQFYLNGVANGSPTASNKKIFTVQNGTYSVKVVDDNGCVAVDSNIIYADDKTVPVVYTNGAYNIQNDVYDDVQGLILSDGNCDITERGIYWSASANMASATKIISNATTDNFVCHIPNVSQGQVLYACAYAVNEKGTGYGDTITLQNGVLPVTVPTVSTTAVSSITSNSAISGGVVTSDGGSIVVTRGVCWNTNHNPTIGDNHTTDGNGLGTFSSNLSNLTQNTTYYVRAYATNSVGTAYGEELSFNTVCENVVVTIAGASTVNYGGSVVLTASGASNYVWSTGETTSVISVSPNSTTTYSVIGTNAYGCSGQATKTVAVNSILPEVTTNSVSNIDFYSATCGGEVISDGGSTVTARGVCWGTAHNPTISISHTTTGNGLGTFSSNLSNLTQNTTYYVRAYATNSVGTAYGNEVSFTTLLPVVDGQPCPYFPTVTDVDGNIYNTVQIGQQCWMQQNLRTTNYFDGTQIQNITNGSQNLQRWYINPYSNDVQTHGLLYNWSATMRDATSSNNVPSGVQGVCPVNWHVPSYAEWVELTSYVSSKAQYGCGGNNQSIAKSLSSTTGWRNNTTTCNVGNDPGSNNATGFNAYPVGFFHNEAEPYYANNGSYSMFFTSTEYSSSEPLCFVLSYNNYKEAYLYADGASGLSIRCIHNDNAGQLTALLPTVTTAPVSSITYNSVNCGGTVTSDGGTSVISRGVCWSTSPNPTIVGDHNLVGSGTGNFSCNLTGLDMGTTYYLRAFAINNVGTAYGDEMVFTTVEIPVDGRPCVGTHTVTDADGNDYSTVQIGNQCWMRENLKTTKYADGSSIPMGGASTSDTHSYWYDPGFSGYVYNWSAVMHGASSSDNNPSGVQGICPNGWHVPSNTEWTQLTDYVSGQSHYYCNNNSSYIAKALSSATALWIGSTNACAPGNSPSTNNSTGFSAPPCGIMSGSSSLFYRESSYFWTSSEGTNGYARYVAIHYGMPTVEYSQFPKYLGYGVRCIRNY